MGQSADRRRCTLNPIIPKPLSGQMLMRAIVNYQRVDPEPTEKMGKFYRWVKNREKEIFKEW